MEDTTNYCGDRPVSPPLDNTDEMMNNSPSPLSGGPTSSSGGGSSTYGMTPEQASKNFDVLRREATKLERHLEDRVARYQQVRIFIYIYIVWLAIFGWMILFASIVRGASNVVSGRMCCIFSCPLQIIIVGMNRN